MGTVGRDLTEIAFMLIGVSVITYMIANSKGTATVFSGAADAFGGLLKTVTFQSQYSASTGATPSY